MTRRSVSLFVFVMVSGGLGIGCGDDTTVPPPPPPSVDASVVPTDGGATGRPQVVSITRSDPMGCSNGVRSNVVLTAMASNTTGTPTFSWATLSGCTAVSGQNTASATWSCPHAATYAGAVTVSAQNGSTTRAFTIPICGPPVLQ